MLKPHNPAVGPGALETGSLPSVAQAGAVVEEETPDALVVFTEALQF
jgi:hypothetical protein